jgi:multiple antibiotic resistance protein
MGIFLRFFGLSFSALLPVINPVGSSLVFLGMVGTASGEVFRTLARKIAASTALFLVIIDVGGAGALKLFGISLPVVQLAGGLVLASMGWQLLNQKEPAAARQPSATPDEPENLMDQVFYPFTFPLTAGPGTLVVMLTLSAHASKGNPIDVLISHFGILSGMAVMCVGVYLCYAYARQITLKVSAQTAHGILRVMAFILLCIGVQIAWNGLHALAGPASLLPK